MQPLPRRENRLPSRPMLKVGMREQRRREQRVGPARGVQPVGRRGSRSRTPAAPARRPGAARAPTRRRAPARSPPCRRPAAHSRRRRSAAQRRRRRSGMKRSVAMQPDQAHRHVDQEDPVPGGVLHQPAAQRRARAAARSGPGSRRSSSPAGTRSRGTVRSSASRPTGSSSAPPSALQHPRRHQLARGRATAAHSTEPSTNSTMAAEEHAPGAEAVGDPARGRNQHRHRQRIGHDHRLHAQRAFAQAGAPSPAAPC